jgi:hypothetical protein
VREALKHWNGGSDAADRKSRLFNDLALEIANKRLISAVSGLKLRPLELCRPEN